ncbi:SdpI family protein [Streptococcus dentiloxodontae]
MKTNKKLLALTSLVILLPVLIGCLLWSYLPEKVATHFSLSGQADGFSSRMLAVFGLPIIFLLLHWFCLFTTSKDPKVENVSPKMRLVTYWIIPLVSCFVMASIYATALGYAVNHALVADLLLGLMFMAIGNYMPKIRRNHTIGIRLPWTLDNADNWIKTHRLAGKIWLLGGLLIFINAFVQIAVGLVLVLTLMVMIGVPVIYSYWLSRSAHDN